MTNKGIIMSYNHDNTNIYIFTYTPGTQITLVLIGKGLVLEG